MLYMDFFPDRFKLLHKEFATNQKYVKNTVYKTVPNSLWVDMVRLSDIKKYTPTRMLVSINNSCTIKKGYTKTEHFCKKKFKLN